MAVAGLALSTVSGPAAAEPVAAEPGGRSVSVTLITGDRVVLHGKQPTIERGPGRERIGFQTYSVRGHTYVIPGDAVKAIGAGRVDERLFDITGLIEAGYDDASTKEIPILATYQGKGKRSAPAGTTVTRQLPAINGAALKVDKKQAKPALLTAAAKVWLDGKRKVSLDKSVPQIGAPAAWQAGFTGKDVKVAVLDTGIDKTHPDLVTQIAGGKNFTAEADGDRYGHGTHVASTIAGTGAASDGKYKGVAPEAQLYDGKVCNGSGSCADSAILAAMDWAANEIKANVVNISLGGPDFPELDPLEEAINRLTAQTGTLFVVAAGNSGPRAGTVESPGSADAALTVGAVDKEEGLADFSSIGPRTGDGALKPDVTAPGVDIIAAKSKDGFMGDPVGDHYTTASGTSMATPHTAGAAALLAQQHPAWKAAELKSALLGSAKEIAGQTGFQQGAGRIDVAQGIKQTVQAVEGSLSFGLAAYPHTDDEPVTKALTYRNSGDQPITLKLDGKLTGPDGKAAPAGALRLSAETLTVPANGTASVQVTSNTKHTGPDGTYAGRITATDGDQTVGTALGVDKEVESYTLTLEAIARDGKPSDWPVDLFSIEREERKSLDTSRGTVQIRLPKGKYLLRQWAEFERAPEDWVSIHLVAPQVELDTDRTVVLDARTAKGVTTKLPDAEAEQTGQQIGFFRRPASPGGQGYFYSGPSYGPDGLFTAGIGPKLSADEFSGHLISEWAVPGADGRFVNSPYVYQLAKTQPGEFPTGDQRVVRRSELAVVDTTLHATSGARINRYTWPEVPGGRGSLWLSGLKFDTPRTVRYYYDDLPGGWLGAVEEQGGGRPPELIWRSDSVDPVRYRAGRTYQDRWNAAAFGPRAFHAKRTADRMLIWIDRLGDSDGRFGGVVGGTAQTVFYRDGQQIATTGAFGSVNVSGLPAGEATYKVVATGTQSVLPFASKVDLTVTFTSAATTVPTDLPISTVRFQPVVDLHNKVARTAVTELPVVVDGTTAVKSLKVQVSGDGTKWTEAKVQRTAKGYRASFATPAGPSVSLRAQLVDKAGNTTEQAVIAAYLLK
ncbi:S8 family serine peptidase [Kribbella sandramycini]